ncbi:MAG: M20/M25/M40 family metallo-hydrolase [Anaerolineales bacterium]|nr:M20/M25/M40 family metallo-hydrolase [Anaerolineales bacterium]
MTLTKSLPPELIERVLDLAVAIQQIPAPTFKENQRAMFVLEKFRSAGLHDTDIDATGNVYGRLPGASTRRPLVVSAHLDTVFPASTDLSLRRSPERIDGPGIGDNSVGVAGMFGLLWALQERPAAARLPGDLWLVANVGEEGLGNLRGMQAVVNRFEAQPLVYLVLEGLALGQVYHRGLAVRRYRISISTSGGHSWVDFGLPSAVHELAKLVTRLAALPLPARPRTTLNVGVIEGGTSVNTIAPTAHLELDLRSESPQALEELVSKVQGLVQNARRADIHALIEPIGQRPAGRLPASHPLIQLARRCLEAQGLDATAAIGSTDANEPLSRGYPSVCLGLTTGYGAHTLNEYIRIAPLRQGLQQLIMFVEGVFALKSSL